MEAHQNTGQDWRDPSGWVANRLCLVISCHFFN